MANLNSIRPEPILVDLGGRVREMKFDLNAFSELERRFGSVDAAMDILQSGNMASIRVIVWAGLIHDEAILDDVIGEPTGYKITPYQVGGWIYPGQLAEVSEKLAIAMTAGMPEEAKKEAMQAVANLKGATPGMATVVPTPEEVAEQKEQERKNA